MEDFEYYGWKEGKATFRGIPLNEYRFKSGCRNCGTWINHATLWNDVRTKEGNFGSCKQYIPKDNLEYLEWEYNRKHGYRISIY